MIKDASIKIIRNMNNLDLDNYDKYINDFHRFSSDMFEHGDAIFPRK